MSAGHCQPNQIIGISWFVSANRRRRERTSRELLHSDAYMAWSKKFILMLEQCEKLYGWKYKMLNFGFEHTLSVFYHGKQDLGEDVNTHILESEPSPHFCVLYPCQSIFSSVDSIKHWIVFFRERVTGIGILS